MNKLYIEFIKDGKVKLNHACLMCENFYDVFMNFLKRQSFSGMYFQWMDRSLTGFI